MGLGRFFKNKAEEAALGMAVDYVSHDKEYGPMYKKIIGLLNHKAVYTGAFLAALPAIATAIAGSLVSNGFDPVLAAHYTAWGGGTVLVVAGIVNKLVKWADDQTPD